MVKVKLFGKHSIARKEKWEIVMIDIKVSSNIGDPMRVVMHDMENDIHNKLSAAGVTEISGHGVSP